MSNSIQNESKEVASTREAVTKMVGNLNFSTHEQALKLRQGVASRARKENVSATIPVGLYLMLETYIISRTVTKSAVIEEGLMQFFSTFPPDQLEQLHRMVETKMKFYNETAGNLEAQE